MSPHPHVQLQALLLATAHGDQGSFAKLYSLTNAHLYGVVVRILGSEHAAEDALQEAYMSIWKNASLYRRDQSGADGQALSPMTWLIAIARNKALDALRKQARLREEELITEGDADERAPTPMPASHETAASALELLTQACEQLHIQQCMGTLSAAQRQSLALCYYQGLTHSEAAQQMGSPIGSVKAWVRRGLQQLKSCLEAVRAEGQA